MVMNPIVRLILLSWATISHSNLVVRTNLGFLKGTTGESRNGETYLAFLGIQYGVVGQRFGPAQPLTLPWTWVKDAREFGPPCPQIDFQTQKPIGDENCLSLNVYVPQRRSERRVKTRPVLIFIHGGGYIQGSSASYGPKYNMDQNLILVTINYRLGAFGFLGLRNSGAPGNVGLGDQVLALKWVRENIAQFGGDKDRVTVMGQSAGAVSVIHLLTSKATKGLFQGAILHSGATLVPWAWRTIDDGKFQAIRLGRKLGCPTLNSNRLLKCLVRKSVPDILKAQNDLAKFYMDPTVPFMPLVDSSNPLAFLLENPVDVLRKGGFHRVPTIVTYCQDEGLLIHAAGIIKKEELMRALDENWVVNGGIQMSLDEDGRLPHLTSKEKKKIMTAVRHHYFGQEQLKANDFPTMFRLSAMYTDRTFVHGIRDTVLAMSAHVPVFIGVFTPVGADSLTRTFGWNETFGVAHGDDLQFFFDSFGFGPFPLSRRLTEFSTNLVQMWANFVQTGVPSTRISGSEFTWSKVTEEERKSRKLKWLDLGNIPRRLVDPNGNRLGIWDEIYMRFGGRKA